MEVLKTKNRLKIKGEYFSVKDILFSGQVFRFRPYEDGFLLAAGRQLAFLRQKGDAADIECTDEEYFYRYFDLDTDYERVTKSLYRFPALRPTIDFGKGIRILRQEKLEALFSFIISAFNNIKRIQKIIGRICEGLGDELKFNGISYHAFPDIKRLAEAGEEFFRRAGVGYRAKYIAETAEKAFSGFDLEAISGLPTQDARKRLMSLMGVGDKVCDCVLLFAYGRQDVFPVDTWMEKVYIQDLCSQDCCRDRKEISRRCVQMFGELSGYAQQYLFYYKRMS
ncbi:MAG: 8-oxoguanine DNA glycosylase [Clostridiales bacterium]|jgi:N-glycosylase/DNA lyase|nr:8-oxoguanine DNA glycosylase [Clostridiales bacterium]